MIKYDVISLEDIWPHIESKMDPESNAEQINAPKRTQTLKP